MDNLEVIEMHLVLNSFIFMDAKSACIDLLEQGIMQSIPFVRKAVHMHIEQLSNNIIEKAH